MKYGAVIIAASMSTRMKKYKQLMNISYASIAERVIVNFRRAGIKDIVLVTGHNAEQIEKSLKGFGVTFIRNNSYESSEMFDSAKMGLKHIMSRCDRVFFCPVDVPFFTDQTVTYEMQMMDENPSARVIIPKCEGRNGHPILIDGKILPHIIAYNGDRGMRGAYRTLPEGSILRIIVDDVGAVLPDDTLTDCQKLVDMHNERILHPEIKLTFATTDRFFGPGSVGLLKEIDRVGNVRDACEKCGFSYSKGWTIIKNCEEKFGYSIVERQVGGQAGGSARVTEKGKDMLAAYEELEAELKAVAEKKFRGLMKKYRLTGEEDPK